MADKSDASASKYSLPHIRIERFRKVADYRPPGQAIESKPSDRERFSHGRKLSGELAQALAVAHRIIEGRDEAVAEGRSGTYLEVETSPGDDLPDLTWTSQGIRLGAIRVTEDGAQVGGLFVPSTAETFLAGKVGEYATGSPSEDLEGRIDKVERIGIATVATLWNDKRELPAAGVAIWWECWCWRKLARNLLRPAERLGLRVSDNRLFFPEFEIIPVHATREEIEKLLLHSDAIEELRRATDSPHVFTHDLKAYQGPLIEDLARRTTAAPADAVVACLLDTGVARAHPLIAPSLPVESLHAVDELWGKDDHKPNGHGTLMAGTALYGDLTYPLADQRTITLSHNLESVTLVPPDGFAPTEPQNYGYVTQSAISLPEIAAPERRRVFCMAVTNEDVSGDVPTTWSAALDQACCGTMTADVGAAGAPAPRRLTLVSAGNIPDTVTPELAAEPEAYPIEDPAQAWNVLTVGGFTDRDEVAHPNYRGWTAAAAVGDRSPFSRVSSGWPAAAPIKPEIVFEAGNRALSPAGRELVAGIESLSLLTTNKEFIAEPLTAFWGTSPATAQGAGMAASIMAAHPDYWPETIRALMVHSARWTPEMQRRFKGCGGRKGQHILLAREFGYGIPSLDRALASASSDLALLAQAEIQPFKRVRVQNKQGKLEYRDPVFNQIDYYPLPWPKRQLEGLGEKLVELRITLSYFIEPSPGQHAPVTPSRYRSHGLRFDLKKSDETEADFYRRINDLERDGEERVKPDSDDRWRFGANSRARNSAGSLHCDVWSGRAADLAGRHALAIHPVSGWWKERVPQKRYDSRTRYALVATITCVEEEVDLYSEVQGLVDIAAEATT
ncbi:MAG: S8 family peptidase [Hyphomicrobiaceae bacterium]